MNRRSSDVDARLIAWLGEGPTNGPDEVLSRTFARARSTRQDRTWLHRLTQPTRFHAMNSLLKVAALAVFALAVGITIAPRGPQIGAAPAPSASPSPSPVRLGEPRILTAGTYYGTLGTRRWTIDVPEGWEWFFSILWSDLGTPGTYEDVGGPGEVAMGWYTVENVFTDPCHWKGSAADPPVGPTVDDLAAALVAQVGRDGSGPMDVLLGGYPAGRVELTVPEDLTTCDEGRYNVFEEAGGAAAGLDSGGVIVMYMLEVDGSLSVLSTWHRADASEEDVAQLDAMIASIVIEPPDPAASASPGPLAWTSASMSRDWPAPVREEPVGAPVVVRLAGGYTDPSGDIESSELPWIDIRNVRFSGGLLVDLAEFIPSPVADPSEQWIAYGLVLDKDGDGIGDVRLGIDNVAEPGHRSHRAWRTDLRTGTTESAAGPPYGKVGDSYFDTFYPGESLPPPTGPPRSARFGLSEWGFHFYAWTSVIEDGHVVATDYAPDAGWLERGKPS